MKSMLYIATRINVPASNGREYMINQSIRMLGSSVVLAVPRKNNFSNKTEHELEDYFGIKKVVFLDLPGASEIMLNFIMRPHFSMQENLFYARKNKNIISGLVSEYGISLVIADMIRMAQYCEGLPVKKVLEMDDILSLRYDRMVRSNLSRDENILGTFYSSLPGVVRVVSSNLYTLILRLEAKLIRRRELAALESFDLVTVVSKKEEVQLKSENPNAVVIDMPPCMEPKSISLVENRALRSAVNLVFMGNLFTSQNLASLQYIVYKLVPELHRIGCLFELHIIGKYDDRAATMCDGKEELVLHGFVEDFSSILNSSDIIIAPIVFGTGIKLKILDGMSFGRPVITTELGVEGIVAENGVHLLVVNSHEEMARMISSLKDDRELCERMGNNAIELIRENYSYEVNREKYLKELEGLC